MRILLVAPDQPHLNSIPEIRIVTQKHHVTVLNGPVSAADVYQACRSAHYQIIHFATQSTPFVVSLTAERLGADDVAQLARMAEAECVVFNSRDAGRLASYAIRHGVRFAVFAHVDLDEVNAWKFPAAFYDALSNGHSRDVIGAYMVADNGDGTYGLVISPSAWQALVEETGDLRRRHIDTVALSWRTMLLLSVTVLGAMLLLAVFILTLAGGWR